MALFAQALGRDVDYSAEVQWRDMSPRSFASTVDGIVKLVESGVIPRTAARTEVPGVTAGKIAAWDKAEQDQANDPTDPQGQLAKALKGAGGASVFPKVNDKTISNTSTAGVSRATGSAVAKDVAAAA